ncbi:MAG: hypothetical protein LBJ10_09125 [Clostridiales bacterium]|jgi:hypothetical protein|nr:hypothetical protein [Clostridiales bacterium]
MPVAASPSEMRRLSSEISKALSQVCSENADVLSALNSLGGSWKDEGYDKIKAFVTTAHKSIESMMPEIQTVCMKLIQYADALEAAQNATR